jgi:thiol-disulfide isomerase/thioredoxin
VIRSFALCILIAAAQAHAQEALPEVGKPALMFRLTTYNPKESGAAAVGLERYVGAQAQDKAAKLVVISFMASFCAPCKKELPALQKLHEQYAADGLRVLLVSVDDQPEGMKVIDELIRANKVTFPVLKDRFTVVARRWLGPQSPLPSLFFVKPDGIVTRVQRGYDEAISASLEREIRAALGKAP